MKKQFSVGYTVPSGEYEDTALLSKMNLRANSNICTQCGCDASCKMGKPAQISVSTSIEPFDTDSGLVDPWIKRPIRKVNTRSKSMSRLVDPLVLETLTANVAIEQVSFPVAVRSLLRYANTLFGQSYVLPKSLRRKLNQSIMDRRRMKKKSKFSGERTFVIHPSTKDKLFDDDEWLEEESSEKDSNETDDDPELVLWS